MMHRLELATDEEPKKDTVYIVLKGYQLFGSRCLEDMYKAVDGVLDDYEEDENLELEVEIEE